MFVDLAYVQAADGLNARDNARIAGRSFTSQDSRFWREEFDEQLAAPFGDEADDLAYLVKYVGG